MYLKISSAANLPKISGFINARYLYSDEAGQVRGFDIRRVRQSADGELNKSFVQF